MSLSAGSHYPSWKPSFDWFGFIVKALIGLAFCFIAIVFLAMAYEWVKHGGCAQEEVTGGMDCYNYGNSMHCEPATKCVLYNDGTRPL